jgi:hypothetical protein
MARDLETRLAATFGPANLTCGMGDLFAPGTVTGGLAQGNAVTCSYMSDMEVFETGDPVALEVVVLMVGADRYSYRVVRGVGATAEAAGVPGWSERDPEWLYRDGLACQDLIHPVTADTAPGPDFAFIDNQGRDPDTPGLSYAEVVAYWYDQGQPTAMDPDRDGRPCTELFDETEVVEVFDQSLRLPAEDVPFAPTVGPVTALDIRTHIAAGGLPPNATQVDCSLAGPVAVGSVFTCAPRLNREPDTTAVVVVRSDGGYLQGPGTAAVPTTPPPSLYRAGLTCAQIQAPITQDTTADLDIPLEDHLDAFPAIGTRGLDYFNAVIYYHLHGQPQELDPDSTGWPCQGEYPAAEVTTAQAQVRIPIPMTR